MAGKTLPTFAAELRLWAQGYRAIAGVDEVGRGPLAGPVVAGAVVLDPYADLPFYSALRDSKALTAPQRERLAAAIRQEAVAWGTGWASHQEIDALGIVPATKTAMVRAVSALSVRPDHLLIDALPLPDAGLPFRAIIKGDALCRSIAAASIIAKVERDGYMRSADATYPGYSFARHKGYPTPQHLGTLARLGPCPLHRRSFAPVQGLLRGEQDAATTLQRARGLSAERVAEQFLESKGYAVLGRNYRCPWGEVDIIAQEGDILAFVEVKGRRSLRMGSPLEAVTPRKQRRLVLTAQDYLERHRLESRPWRIDVVAVAIGADGLLRVAAHLPNAIGEGWDV